MYDFASVLSLDRCERIYVTIVGEIYKLITKSVKVMRLYKINFILT